MDIQIKPMVTEKATAYSEIKDIVEKMYNVRVEKVNISNYAGKRKSRYTKKGLVRGRQDAFKKAYVTVAEGQKIDYYSNL